MASVDLGAVRDCPHCESVNRVAELEAQNHLLRSQVAEMARLALDRQDLTHAQRTTAEAILRRAPMITDDEPQWWLDELRHRIANLEAMAPPPVTDVPDADDVASRFRWLEYELKRVAAHAGITISSYEDWRRKQQ